MPPLEGSIGRSIAPVSAMPIQSRYRADAEDLDGDDHLLGDKRDEVVGEHVELGGTEHGSLLFFCSPRRFLSVPTG